MTPEFVSSALSLLHSNPATAFFVVDVASELAFAADEKIQMGKTDRLLTNTLTGALSAFAAAGAEAYFCGQVDMEVLKYAALIGFALPSLVNMFKSDRNGNPIQDTVLSPVTFGTIAGVTMLGIDYASKLSGIDYNLVRDFHPLKTLSNYIHQVGGAKFPTLPKP
jgi:hypothetical protein